MSLSLILYGTADRDDKSIEAWLHLNYVNAQKRAREALLNRVDTEYVFAGRFNDSQRNVKRTLESISAFYGQERPLRRQMNLRDPKDNGGIFLPVICFRMLVKEVMDAAYGEYYYRYEKRWD